jgi:hypothetical protein
MVELKKQKLEIELSRSQKDVGILEIVGTFQVYLIKK